MFTKNDGGIIMPNHITNRLVINANEVRVQEILGFLKGDNQKSGSSLYIDFNKIIPMPSELEIESGSRGDIGKAYILSRQKGHPLSQHEQSIIQYFEEYSDEEKKSCLELGMRYIMNQAKYGFETWYEWCQANWGTKWNAYNQNFEAPNTIWFDTAWSGVPELMQKLSMIFPDAEFNYAYADENTGSNTGTGTIKNGELAMYYPANQSNDAYELCFELNPNKEGYYKLTDEGYKYKEEGE